MKTGNSERSALRTRLAGLSKAINRYYRAGTGSPERRDSNRVGNTSGKPGEAMGIKKLQNEFDSTAKALKKVSGGSEATRKAAPKLKTSPAKKKPVVRVSGAGKPAAKPAAKKEAPKETFSQAFAKARRERVKSNSNMHTATFTWNGKKYHTRNKAEQKEHLALSKKATGPRASMINKINREKLTGKKSRR
tara:strand:- start:22 stop:594 length:573 start_codon:yes stop_codon:yes gene_type:complete